MELEVGHGEPSQLIPVGSRISPVPPVVPSNGRAPEVGRRGPRAHRRPAKAAEHLDLPPRGRLLHRLRGRPTLHPEGCSSSCCSSSSMPSRMKGEAFLYLVNGTSVRM